MLIVLIAACGSDDPALTFPRAEDSTEPGPDPDPEDPFGAPCGATNDAVDGEHVTVDGFGSLCAMDAPIEEQCDLLFGPSSDGCCPSFRTLLQQIGWKSTTGMAAGSARRCVDVRGDRFDTYWWSAPGSSAYELIFDTDGTLLALGQEGKPGPSYYDGWCCEGGFTANLWWGSIEEIGDLDCFGDGAFAYEEDQIFGTEDEDPGCDSSPPPDTGTTPPASTGVRKDDTEGCGCDGASTVPGAAWLVAFLALGRVTRRQLGGGRPAPSDQPPC